MGRVIIFGSINMDCVATVQNHPKPGETVSGSDLQYFPGGKGANQAVASSRLGAHTFLFGAVGNDGFANTLLGFLKKQNIDISTIERLNFATGTAFIAVDDNGENTIIVIPGANNAVSFGQVKDFKFEDGDILVCQNEVSTEEMLHVFKKAKNEKAVIIYNPAPAKEVPDALLELANYIVVNEIEAQFYRSQIDTNRNILIETKGDKGVLVTDGDDQYTIEAEQVDVVDTTGAGDCFTGAFAASLANGFALYDALSLANKAAALSIQKDGAGVSMPYLHEIEEKEAIQK